MQVDFFFEKYSGKQKQVMLYLHRLISNLPQVTSKIAYGIPFYYRKSWLCYINPRKQGAVELCFTRGNELSNEQGILMANKRKQIRGITFSAVSDIPERGLLEILNEALLLDDQVPYASKNKKRKRSA
jgi:hypothetical protein